MYQLANGYTKESVMEKIRKYNNGTVAAGGEPASCLYQSPDGNRCFIGCFIPDNKIREIATLGKTVDVLLERHPELRKSMPFADLLTLSEFQRVHDSLSRGDTSRDPREAAQTWLDENVA